MTPSQKCTHEFSLEASRSNPNSIPVNRSKSSTYGEEADASKKQGKQAHMNSVRAEQEQDQGKGGDVIELSLTEQDNEVFDELISSVCNTYLFSPWPRSEWLSI
jgi:hypothetical protein